MRIGRSFLLASIFGFGMLATAQMSAAFIIGNYIDPANLPVYCRMSAQVDSTHVNLCSATLLNNHFALTAKHCVQEILNQPERLPKLLCDANGGRDRIAKQITGIRVFKPEIKMTLQNVTPDQWASDLALISLDQIEPMPELFGGEKGMVRLAASDEEVRALIESRMCSLSGWGKENIASDQPGISGGDSGVLHTVIAPFKMLVGATETLKRIDEELNQAPPPNAAANALTAKLATEPAEGALYGGFAYIREGTMVSSVGLMYPSDPSMRNSAQVGDSGGPLICARTVNQKTEYIQVGVISNTISVEVDPKKPLPETRTVLLGRPEVQTWLKEAMDSMK
jgi:hypothetical protein